MIPEMNEGNLEKCQSSGRDTEGTRKEDVKHFRGKEELDLDHLTINGMHRLNVMKRLGRIT